MGRPDRYLTTEGKKVPSVTTILGKFKDPGPLIYWAMNTAMEVLEEAYSLLQTPAQLTNLKAAQHKAFMNSKPLDRANCRKKSETALTAGNIAHDMVEMWIHADKTEQSNLARKSLKAIKAERKCTLEAARQGRSSFQGFLRWIDTNKFWLYKTEEPLVSDEHRYGGTLDCVGEVNGKLCLLDWKTSKALYDDYLLQLAAYGMLWNEWYDQPIEEYHLLRFDKQTGDFQHFSTNNLEMEKRAFLLLRELYDMKAAIKKRI